MTEKPLILLGADHAGFALKEEVKTYLLSQGLKVEDLSPTLVPGDDYPLIAKAVAKRIAASKNAAGILFCGSGIGMDIAANRVRGARAAVARNIKEAKLSRTDDFANILVLGSMITPSASAKLITSAWLATPYSKAKRHVRRVKELD